MLTIEQIKKQLQDRRPGMIRKVTGLSLPTILNVRDGVNKNPTLRVMQLLSDYLESDKNL